MTTVFVQQPITLENFAIRKFGDWVALQAEKLMLTPNMPEDLLSTHIEGIQLLIYKVPYILHDEVVSEALKSLTELRTKTLVRPNFSHEEVYFSDPEIELLHRRDIIKRVTETLFTENLTSLMLQDQIQDLETYILTGTGLTSLSIRFFDGKEPDIIAILKQLPNLERFEYWLKCTENVFKCLAENCKQIEHLVLFIADGINDENIDLLITLPNLNFVQLNKSFLTEIGVMVLLLGCENLEHIDIESDENGICLVNILKNIARSTVNLQLNLRSFNILRFIPTVEDMHIISEICPLLEETSIFSSHFQSHIKLNNLQNLTALSLNCFNFYDYHTKQLPGLNNLETLDLTKCQIDLNMLAYISQSSPNLKVLSIDFVKPLVCHNKPVPKPLPFKNLTLLYVSGDPSDVEFTFIVSNCPNVESLIFNNLKVLTDNVMLRVLEKNPLHCLKELQILNNMLSRSVLDRMVPNYFT